MPRCSSTAASAPSTAGERAASPRAWSKVTGVPGCSDASGCSPGAGTGRAVAGMASTWDATSTSTQGRSVERTARSGRSIRPERSNARARTPRASGRRTQPIPGDSTAAAGSRAHMKRAHAFLALSIARALTRERSEAWLASTPTTSVPIRRSRSAKDPTPQPRASSRCPGLMGRSGRASLHRRHRSCPRYCSARLALIDGILLLERRGTHRAAWHEFSRDTKTRARSVGPSGRKDWGLARKPSGMRSALRAG